jgi:hypothetical protein
MLILLTQDKPMSEIAKPKPVWKWQLFGLIVMWILIMINPSLGSTTTGLMGFGAIQGTGLYNVWNGYWGDIGYKVVPEATIIRCDSNHDGSAFFQFCLVLGFMTGVIGGIYQAFLIKLRWGKVKTSTVIMIPFLWGILLSWLSLGSATLLWLNSDGKCESMIANLIISVFMRISLHTFLVVLPVPIILILGFIFTYKQWEWAENSYRIQLSIKT